MMPNPGSELKRRATGIWNDEKDPHVEKKPLVERPTSAIDPLNCDYIDGSFEFGGIRVKLVTYMSIPGVIQINVLKTLSEWNKLRALNHTNIVGFDDSNPSISHWIPISDHDDEGDPKGLCELYISKPPLAVTVAAATAQHRWSVLDAHRMCKDIINALKFLADHSLCRGHFATEHVLVTGEGFKLANIHLCDAVKVNDNVQDLQSVGQILKEILIGKSTVLGNVEWYNFYIVTTKEINFNSYRDALPRLLLEHWPRSGGEYDTTSQNDRLHGIAYLTSQRQQNTFEW